MCSHMCFICPGGDGAVLTKPVRLLENTMPLFLCSFWLLLNRISTDWRQGDTACAGCLHVNILTGENTFVLTLFCFGSVDVNQQMSPGHSGQVWGHDRTLVLGVQVHLGSAHRDSGEHFDLRQPEPTSVLRCWKVTKNPKQAWLPSITGTSRYTLQFLKPRLSENALLSGLKGHFGIFYIIKQTCTQVLILKMQYVRLGHRSTQVTVLKKTCDLTIWRVIHFLKVDGKKTDHFLIEKTRKFHGFCSITFILNQKLSRD